MQPLAFGPFLLDPDNARLVRDETPVSLTPKAFALLCCLARQPGRLLTKQHLLDASWPDRVVVEAVLKVTLREIRQALGDDSRSPCYIETVHRRGYRFIGQVVPVNGDHAASTTHLQPIERGNARPNIPLSLVGREADLHKLRQALDRTLSGALQVLFLTGEPGIGKTTLVQAFIRQLRNVYVVCGHCFEHYGALEAYLPVLETLSQLCWNLGDDTGRTWLRRHAPTWLVQMPRLIGPEDAQALRRETLGATRARMLWEMTEALTELTRERPLIIVLEDLHWGDASTLDLISALTHRQNAHLLLIATAGLGKRKPHRIL